MRSMVDAVRVCAALLVVGNVCSAARGEPAVIIEKGKATVEYKTFDPQHLPDPPPPVAKGESAVTVYNYLLATDLVYTAMDVPRGASGPVKINFRVDRVKVRLNLEIIVWLPEGAPQRLKDHEEGHRQLAELYYKDAEATARRAAATVAGKTMAQEGSDFAAAEKAVLEKANKMVCDRFLEAVATPCQKAQDAFDRLTDHGRKATPTAKEAVEAAAKEGREVKKK